MSDKYVIQLKNKQLFKELDEVVEFDNEEKAKKFLLNLRLVLRDKWKLASRI